MLDKQHEPLAESAMIEDIQDELETPIHYGIPGITEDRADQKRNKRIYWIVKRGFDIFVSATTLVVLSPLMLCIAIVIVIDDPKGSPIYKQKRCGRHGKEFVLYKFRSMCIDADKLLDSLLPQNEMTGPVFKMRNDPRITKVGRFLRRTSIDEVLQFLNVLRGDMSIIGPRPPLPREVAQYTENELRRLWITPGITCIWQVTPNRNAFSFEEWMEMDVNYLERRSWRLDLKLMCRTVRVIFRGEGI
jgi:lipopolysaccharide/colanic/teichoic acid biosynthesis glycosyltransferase